MSALSFEHVTYTYPGATRAALDDVTLTIAQGELCVLAGLSGHGKSTLLRAGCGLAPHFYGGTFAGRVRIEGLDTHDNPPARLGALTGVLFQDPETQLVMGSVRGELALPLESRGHSDGEVARGVEEAALALGIDGLLDRSTHELSGGEQQRVALGAALVGRPRVVLLDEPTSQLDPVAGDELIGLLRRLNQEWDTTIVLCEHRLERCLPAADRVIAMHEGKVAYDGLPGAFLEWAGASAPALQTPGAKLFSLAGVSPAPVGVKQARAALRREGLLGERQGTPALVPGDEWRASGSRSGLRPWVKRRVSFGGETPVPVVASGLWLELTRGPAIVRGVDLSVKEGETVALMGRNGAGKSTLLRLLAGLLCPTRGSVRSAGRVALLLQNPNDYFLHERVAEEAPAGALAAARLAHLAERNPRDLSGGERQRLALAIVAPEGGAADGVRPPAVLALDEPTRGMDREAKAALAAEIRRRASEGQAVIVATHDPEFAAACADRAVLLAEGRAIADAPTAELLTGGWYFATETARILGGEGGALDPLEGAQVLRERALAGALETSAAIVGAARP
ncbi:MAG TPA: ATP-binding cassette domain-containing protein [Solirubrobacteraceae bacterium]